ncbi:hypothetical protein SEUCBS139899_003450 [Sporothrix eucalyptigena]|uniref:Uncharacterized protein n=1 Tax=Sporothrix eucalyptigena TaxID=1812306 RepID=A0ABP0BV28_9PEZI
MPNYTRHDTATSNVLAWTAHATNAVEEDAAADVDEPPDHAQQTAAAASQQEMSVACHTFQKTVVYRPRERTESLLTRALQSQSEDETADNHIAASGLYPRRRRSITSNTSMASTAGFTSDTGITTPPRTNSPSPRLISLGFAPVNVPSKSSAVDTTPKPASTAQDTKTADSQQQVLQKKRCISFACGAVKPSQAAEPASPPAKVTKTPGPDDTPKAVYAQLAQPAQMTEVPKLAEPKRSCIRFVCPARPSEAQKPQLSTLKADAPENRKLSARRPSPAPEPKSPTAMRKLLRRNSAGRSPRSVTRSSASRQSSHSPIATRSKKYYNAEPGDLNKESSRFHEFASDAPLEDDWLRHDKVTVQQRLTIDDTLKKEMAIRLLGREAEEEAEQEEEDENDDEDDVAEDDDDDDDDDDDEDDDEDDDADENDTVEGDNEHLDGRFSGYSSGGEDGYNTDNETGFASSDEEDDGLVLWTVNQSGRARREHNFDNDHSTLHQGGSPVFRRLSVDEHSDSSGFIAGRAMRQDRPKNRELVNSIRRPATPELPDSTDFVCGTFDEDRPLEEAYQSHIAARKRGKVHVIPQDIDPSFPTSDPEDNSDDEPVKYKRGQQAHGSADERFWEIEDIHHDQADRADIRRKKKAESPRRCRSPPPPKARGRSPAPRRLFDHQSPTRRLKSPAPKAIPVPIMASSHARIVSPPASLVDADGEISHPPFPALAFKPGLTQTKSLPRPSAIFRHQIQQQANVAAGHAQPSKPFRRHKANSLAGAKQPRHVRGAIDIVKGLEQKRQRRREKFQQKHCDRARKGQVPERRTQRGEGAERMREVGLLMAGKIPQGNYVLSV